MLTTDVLPQYTSTSLGWQVQREMHTVGCVCGKEKALLASTHHFGSAGPSQPAYGPSVGPDARPRPLSLKGSNTSNLDLCHLLWSECQLCRPSTPPAARLTIPCYCGETRHLLTPPHPLRDTTSGSAWKRPARRGETVKGRLIARWPPLFQLRHSGKTQSLKMWWGLRPPGTQSCLE